MPESHHETDSADRSINGEAPDVAGPISIGRGNGAIARHEDGEDDLKKVLDESRSSEPTLRQIIHKIPTLAWCNLPDGSSEFLNERWHDYTGLSPQEAHCGGMEGCDSSRRSPSIEGEMGNPYRPRAG